MIGLKIKMWCVSGLLGVYCGIPHDCVAVERPLLAESNIVVSVSSDLGGEVKLQLDYPELYTNRLDIYVSTNLVLNKWTLVGWDLSTLGTNAIAWNDPAAGNASARFYRAGNADLDTDLDGLADARELLIYQTDPQLLDSDQDSVPDGAELLRGTDPVESGSALIMLYGDSDAGSDVFDGYAPEAAEGHGPKRSLSAAIAVSYAGDVIQLSGLAVYSEPDLWVGSHDLTLRPQGFVCVQP